MEKLKCGNEQNRTKFNSDIEKQLQTKKAPEKLVN